MKITQEAASEVLRLRSGRRGTLSSERVVSFARDPETSLHRYFEWDDSVAGHKFRLKQAHELVRSVTVEYRPESNPARAVEAVAFVRDPAAGPQESRFAYLPRLDRPGASAVIRSELKQVRGDLRRAVSIAEAKRSELPRGVCTRIGRVLDLVQEILNSIT